MSEALLSEPAYSHMETNMNLTCDMALTEVCT